MIRLVAWRRLAPAAAILAAALAACSATQVQKAGAAQAEIAHLCALAMPLANLDPAVGVYVTGACASEEAIAKVALSPGSIAWLERLYQELLALSPAK